MFFDLCPTNEAYLADSNNELVNCYRTIRERVSELIIYLRSIPIDEGTFYRMRSETPRCLSSVVRAARMIYLNKTCFNGLYRVNKSGRFNSPWGHWPSDKLPTVCDEENLRNCSRALQSTTIHHCDFQESCLRATPGDFVYLDPPYVPANKTSNFTSYTADKFGPKDLEDLAETCAELSLRGVRFMLSNADLPQTRDAFSGFRIDPIQARRSVNCKGAGRGKVGEIVVRNYGDDEC